MTYNISASAAKYAYSFSYTSNKNCGSFTVTGNFTGANNVLSIMDASLIKIDKYNNEFVISSSDPTKAGTYGI